MKKAVAALLLITVCSSALADVEITLVGNDEHNVQRPVSNRNVEIQTAIGADVSTIYRNTDSQGKLILTQDLSNASVTLDVKDSHTSYCHGSTFNGPNGLDGLPNGTQLVVDMGGGCFAW